MPEYILSFKPSIGLYGSHDPSAALFKNNKLVFAVEEERYTRSKHASGTFPLEAINGCLNAESLEMPDVDKIVLPYRPELFNKIWKYQLTRSIFESNSIISKGLKLEDTIKKSLKYKYFPNSDCNKVKDRLRTIDTPIPDIEHKSHHKCHAASAFYPTNYKEALVLTIDGRGEYDSTVIWKGSQSGLERKKTFEFPNSLGHFYATITEFLGYRRFNGEGKVMGLAPYGEENQNIKKNLKNVIVTSSDYDVTEFVKYGMDDAISRLESLFNRPSKEEPTNFTDWEKDLAYTAQSILEEIIINIIKKYTRKLNIDTVCLAGGVALNCKMNKVIEQSSLVKELYIQPVAHDAGLALGGGWLMSTPKDIPEMNNVYYGPDYSDEIEEVLEETKITYNKTKNTPEKAAKLLSDGQIIGWFQGKSELGPRALGNRSILADPRTIESRDKVNKYVKHREEWRPFAPSLKEEALDEYLINATPSPFMIKTYDVHPNKQDEIPAVLHPADGTTRPQTVNKNQNPKYYALLSKFEDLTGVPVVLNTSFNDHAEPIVNHPKEAIKDFYGMGLDALILDNYILTK